MSIVVVTPPVPFVTYDEAKAQIRGDDDAERDLIESYILAAIQWLDGPAGWLGRSLGEQTLELSGCALINRTLPFGPIIAVESVIYTNSAGGEVTMPAEDYRLLPDGTLYATTWPAVGSDPSGVRIRYRAGYPDNVTPAEGEQPEVRVSTVPAPIRQAVLLLVGYWFRNREAVVTGTIATSLPFAVDALLAPYRRWV